MSHDVEHDLRDRLHAEAGKYHLAPEAVAVVTERGRRRLRRRRAVTGGTMVLVVVAAGSMAAMTGWDGRADNRTAVTADAPGSNRSADKPAPQLIARAKSDDFPGLFAKLIGTLVLTEDNCIAVATGDGGRRIGVVWGHGWSAGWEDGAAVVYDANRAVFAREGDRVGLGGGEVTGDTYSGHPCGTDPIFAANDVQAPRTPTR